MKTRWSWTALGGALLFLWVLESPVLASPSYVTGSVSRSGGLYRSVDSKEAERGKKDLRKADKDGSGVTLDQIGASKADLHFEGTAQERGDSLIVTDRETLSMLAQEKESAAARPRGRVTPLGASTDIQLWKGHQDNSSPSPLTNNALPITFALLSAACVAGAFRAGRAGTSGSASAASGEEPLSVWPEQDRSLLASPASLLPDAPWASSADTLGRALESNLSPARAGQVFFMAIALKKQLEENRALASAYSGSYQDALATVERVETWLKSNFKQANTIRA